MCERFFNFIVIFLAESFKEWIGSPSFFIYLNYLCSQWVSSAFVLSQSHCTNYAFHQNLVCNSFQNVVFH